MMRILLACECSGAVRDAMLAKGHEALSCDLLRQLDAPPLASRTGICAATIVADVDALATEWSRGNALSMIGDAEAAQHNAEAIIIEAAARILARGRKVSRTVYRYGVPTVTRAAGLVMADVLQAYQDENPDDLEAYAAEAAEWFRLQGECVE